MWQKKRSSPAALLDASGLKSKAIELLARREYSYSELETKLLPIASDENLVYEVLDWMVEEGFQSDERFTEMFLRSKALSGYGPIRIKMELRQKGIAEDLTEQAFEASTIEWETEVYRLIEKKLGKLDEVDIKSKQKCIGFLQRRGFNSGHIFPTLEKYLSGEEIEG